MKRLSLSIAGASILSFLILNSAPANGYEIKPIETDYTGFKDLIDEFQQFVHGSDIPFDAPEAYALDPTQLKLAADHNVRVYFLNEGAGFKNQLTFTATDDSNLQSGIIFNNISCRTGNKNKDCRGPSEDGVLDIGDYVDLGNFSAGTQFDFQLIANGFNGGKYIYGADLTKNPDGLSHLVAYQYKNYLVLGFEDLFGPLHATNLPNQNSDRDFEDTVFVVDLPIAKSVPEPSVTLALFGAGAMGLVGARRHRPGKNAQSVERV